MRSFSKFAQVIFLGLLIVSAVFVVSCGAVKKILEVTRYGDVMPCVFIHIATGNVFDDSLAEIMERGLSIRHFRNSSPICLSGVDRRFIKKHMSKFYGKKLPISYKEAFSEEDFVKDDK